jgi:hypothetical protein
LERAKLDGGTYNNLLSKLSFVEQDVIDLKNRHVTNAARTQIGGDGLKSGESLMEEINNIWSFTQRFIDEHALDMIQEVGTPDRPIRDKMNRMDWLSRYTDYLSPDQITKCLLAFKDQFNGASMPAR